MLSRLALAAFLGFAAAGCAVLPRIAPPWTVRPRLFHGTQTNSGPEPYASTFGDSDGRILYFGLSPFLELAMQCEAEGGKYCALRDFEQPGDHLIGRFDLEEERFLDPLVVRAADPQATSSVWDVLVHSNGRIYYTTVWNEFGSVRPDGSDVRYYPDAGIGLDELWEGPDGEIYATRYLGSGVPGAADENGAVVVFGPDGERRRQFPFAKEEGAVICPKSLAVDPRTREIWVNSDIFYPDGRPIGYDTFRLSPQGEILERIATPVVVFMSFDHAGRGWFVDDVDGHWFVRIVEPNGRTTRVDIGSHAPIDVVQDIKHSGNVTLLSTWGRTVHVVRALAGGAYETFALPVAHPRDCPRGVALGHTAVLSPRGVVYETVTCRITVARAGAVDP